MVDQFFTVPWSTFEDYKADKIIGNDDGIMVIRYCGQNYGRRDNFLMDSKFFIGGKSGKRKLLGEVLSVTEIPKQKTRMFIIVLKKCNDEQPTFRTKNALCEYYGWSACDDHIQGITRHTKLML